MTKTKESINDTADVVRETTRPSANKCAAAESMPSYRSALSVRRISALTSKRFRLPGAGIKIARISLGIGIKRRSLRTMVAVGYAPALEDLLANQPDNSDELS